MSSSGFLASQPAALVDCAAGDDGSPVKRRRRRRRDGRPSEQQQNEHKLNDTPRTRLLSLRNAHVLVPLSPANTRPLPHRKTLHRSTHRFHPVTPMLIGGTIVVAALVFHNACCADALKLASAVPAVVAADLPLRPASRPAASAADPTAKFSGSGGGGSSSSGTRGIGDMHRSDSSTSRFFQSIDSDGDGILEKPEMESFVRETIGGSAFDTSDEVEAGVDQVLEQLDRDRDDGLDKNDVLAYWMQLESLLTAEEVSEWVVHAVQLPESVGDLFLENLVTGYDFPELVDHDGEVIETELGIEKASHRKKILRHINARMLGIGSVPSTPQNFRHTLESCSTVSLMWTRSTAKGFPVHSYRVQRRAVPLRAASPTPNVVEPPDSNKGLNGGSSNVAAPSTVQFCDAAIDASQTYFPVCGISADVSFSEDYALACAGADSTTLEKSVTKIVTKPVSIATSAPSRPKSSSWVIVYRGGDNEFVDTGLETGFTYVYRVQAWNSVGRSEWVTLDIARSLKKQRCTTADQAASMGSKTFDGILPRARSYHHDDSDGWNILQTIYLIFDFVSTFIRAVFALAAVGAAIMRFKRANAMSSTSASMDPVFPWLWRGMNMVTLKIFGVEVVPKSMLGDKKTKQVSERAYDREVKSVGLVGYKGPSSRDEERSPITSRPYRRVMFAQRKSASTGTLMANLEKINENGLLQNRGHDLRNGSTAQRAIDNNEAAPSTFTPAGSATSSKSRTTLKRAFFSRSKSAGSDDTSTGESSEDDARMTTRSLPAHITTSRRSLMSNMSIGTIDEDDGTVRTNDSSSRVLMVDDYNRCNACHKRYKFPHRFRHHCARCLSTFCHKHGKTSHSNLVACKVPSDCICNVCLEVDAITGSSRSRSSGSRSGGSTG